MFKKNLRKLLLCKRALAIPMTYLILFVSLMAIISATYSLAIIKISARGALLKVSLAKQSMQILDDAVHSVAWSFGASEVVYVDDAGGVFQTEPFAKELAMNLTDEGSFSSIVFNSSVGKAIYELEPSEFNDDSLFIKGDQRSIINQSSSTVSQLYFATGSDAKELILCYRPSVTAACIGLSNGKQLNLIRIYIMNLNSSENLILREKFYLRVTGLNVTTARRQYDFNVSVSSLALKAIFDGTLSSVWLPVSCTLKGAIVNLEIVVCNIKIQKVGG